MSKNINVEGEKPTPEQVIAKVQEDTVLAHGLAAREEVTYAELPDPLEFVKAQQPK